MKTLASGERQNIKSQKMARILAYVRKSSNFAGVIENKQGHSDECPCLEYR